MENSQNLPGGSGGQRPPARTAETMFPLIEEQQSGSMSQKQFCALYGISPHIFSYWLRKYRNLNPEKGDFVELTPVGVRADGCDMRLVLAGGRSLEFSGIVPVKYLSDLIRELA